MLKLYGESNSHWVCLNYAVHFKELQFQFLKLLKSQTLFSYLSPLRHAHVGYSMVG